MSKKLLTYFLILLVCFFPVNFASSFLSSPEIYPEIVTGVVIVPGTNLEKLYLSGQADTWVEDGARRSNGFVQYTFPLLGGLPVAIELDCAGPYVVEVSMGGEEFQSIYSSGQMDGALSGRMRRQIRVDLEPAHPMKIRLSKKESASDPFTLWRMNVLRQHDIFPGSEIEKKLLINEGASTLSEGGGRIIPANSSISFSLIHAKKIPTTILIEADKKLETEVDGVILETEIFDNKRWLIIPGSNEIAILKLIATEETKLKSLSMIYGLTPIDVKSDIGKIFVTGERSGKGIPLSDKPIAVVVPVQKKYFWCVATNPDKFSIYGIPHETRSGASFAKLDENQKILNITGDGELLCFAFDNDMDEDGIPSFLEMTLGTDPFLTRTDNDNKNDYDDNRPLDTDNDGLDDEVEKFLMISTIYPDTDSDGFPDGLGLSGHKPATFSARVSDKPWIGAQFQDVTNYSIIPECRKFGMTSAVIDFHQILTQRKPDEKMLSAFEAVGDCDGYLLDVCAIHENDFKKNPSLIDEYQIWAKRLWTDVETDDSLAFTLHNFAHDRITGLLKLAKEYADQFNQQIAISIPSPSQFDSWILPYNSFENVDRIIVQPPIFAGDGQMYLAGLFDANFIGKPFFVQIKNEKAARAYISAVRDTGFYLGSAVDGRRPLVLSGEKETLTSNFVQIVNESTVWSKKLDAVNIHQNWLSSFATKEYFILPSRIKNLSDKKVAILDTGTTFITQDELPEIESWIKAGGNLLVYENPSRFDEFMWWGGTSSLGEVMSKDLEILGFEPDKMLSTGKGHLYVTKNDPMFSLDIFKIEAGFEITPLPSSYAQITDSIIEISFSKFVSKSPGEYPKTEYPIHIKPVAGDAPYVVASTCAVPWIGGWNDNLRILAQAPRGMCSTFALAIPGKPLSVISNTTMDWSYKNGILFVSFTASGGGDGFVVSLTEGLDISAVNLSMQPKNPEEQSHVTVLATIYNTSNLPSGEYSVTFHWDELTREKQFKRLVQSSIAPLGYEYLSFTAPVYLEPGNHKLHMMIHTDDELNLANNKKMIEFEVKKSPRFKTISMQIGSTNAFVDGVTVVLDSPPVIRNGRTMVPFRFLAETLGAEIGWNAYERRVSFIKGDTVMYLWIGKKSAIVNSQMIELDSEPIIVNGRTMVPLRVISENLGAEVSWDGVTRTVTIRMLVGED